LDSHEVEKEFLNAAIRWKKKAKNISIICNKKVRKKFFVMCLLENSVSHFDKIRSDLLIKLLLDYIKCYPLGCFLFLPLLHKSLE